MSDSRWSNYYQMTRQRTRPRKALLIALDQFKNESGFLPSQAIDLGCGSGSDSLYLLRSGWRVTAMDSSTDSMLALISSLPLSLSEKLLIKLCKFEGLSFLPQVHFVNASFSLPFLDKSEFYLFWPKIINSISSGGRFAGSFFGSRDDWHKRDNMTFLSYADILNLFSKLEIEYFEEEEPNEAGALDKPKHWHKYHIVAKKA
ncbi:Tellurite methyltransferase [Aquicella siphonis]|uniref:Tellurite methyltransferase n=1 Tax=Aquicella siphonis TaxID=254247 RepID=A0A5E4PLG2_9COXI|nr:class I SAM-dependent methyltransferase [Aquicella siphonis]VVC77153.1 Tellurite methyltransferase [Aquicella siphonis]